MIRGLLSGKRERGRESANEIPNHVHIELSTADHEEPTWEVRPAGDSGRRRRIDGRTRSILGIAAAAAIVVNAGAAWAYWRVTQTSPVPPAEGTAVQLMLRARNDLNNPLTPGHAGNLTVTVTNEYNFPIRIKRVEPGRGNVVADDEHREAGCANPGLRITQSQFDVLWDVPRNTIGVFTIVDGLTMSRSAPKACDGAVFTVPVQVNGNSLQSG